MRNPVPRDDPGNAIRSELRARQRPDGGWSARPGGPADAESTAWAVMALGSAADRGAGDRGGVDFGADGQAAVRGRRWLLGSQRTDGGWAWSADGPESGWPTAPAVLALAAHPGSEDATASGGRWLLRNRAWTYPLKARFLLWLFRRRPPVELDFSLHGWPWVPGTFGWVEPTSWALLALRATEALLPPGPFRGRSEDGEAMLLDRACVGGGWNYGNRTVLGENLWPYPDTTAIALLALTRRTGDLRVREGLDALEDMLSEPASRLSLALAVLALEAHGRETADLLERLRTRWSGASDPATTRTASLAVLALRGVPIPGAGTGGSA